MRLNAILAIIFVFSGCSSFQLNPGYSTLFPGHEARDVADACWPGVLAGIEDEWDPTAEVITQMETLLKDLNKAIARTGCTVSGEPKDINRFRRQYFGVVLSGRRVVFINAFDLEIGNGQSNGKPNKMCAAVNDGYCSFWSAIYDPETQMFEKLKFAALG